MKFTIVALVLIVNSILAQNTFKCPADGLQRDPDDCEIFWSCNGGTGTRQICPVGLIFNSVKKVCDFPSNVSTCQPVEVTNVLWKQCHELGFVGCKTYPGPSDVKCCGARSACYNFGGSGGINKCVST